MKEEFYIYILYIEINIINIRYIDKTGNRYIRQIYVSILCVRVCVYIYMMKKANLSQLEQALHSFLLSEHTPTKI